MTSTGNFHINSDVDRLYAIRDKGGRGLNSLVDIFISRIISISYHLKESSCRNSYLKMVLEHEKEDLMRVSEELAASFGVETEQNDNVKKISVHVKQKLKENHLKAWIDKPQHGYLMRSRETVQQKNEVVSNAWMKKSSFSSHVEGYICAIQEEEIFTNALRSKRMKKEQVNPNCRLCKNSAETIQHIVAACPKLSASMYLPWRHNKVANVVYQNIVSKGNEKARQSIQEVYVSKDTEIWWDTKINTSHKCEHNKPDIVLWKKQEKKCYIIDICVCLDVNIDKNIKLKLDNYLPLAAELKRLYKDYTFEILPIIIGATGLVTASLVKNLKTLNIENVKEVTLKCQKSALLGTMKIVKSFMKM